MNFLALIEAKRDGHELTAGQIREVVSAYAVGEIPDYQMAAFLMAVHFRRLNANETSALTLAMRDSGDKLEFPADPRPLVDKHSTGGVGDKVSLPLAPLLACLGFRVPMISGRGLGITGGTLDKLDSIPGFQTSLPRERILEIVQQVGCVICGQTERMVPADKKLYALRDATATVPSIPLIVSSILSKKLAEGIRALILDVKCGRAAFMPTPERARELAAAMVNLGNSCGVNTRALISRMDVPLGRAAGNWLEVKESIECLAPNSAAATPGNDLIELVLLCAAHLLVQTGRAASPTDGVKMARECLSSGRPRQKWDEMIKAQGADLEVFNRKLSSDHLAPAVLEVKAPRSGFVSACDARVIGELVRDLGGGRLHKDSSIDYHAGIDRLAKPGEKVVAGDIIARVHAGDSTIAADCSNRVLQAFHFSDAAPTALPVVMETVP